MKKLIALLAVCIFTLSAITGFGEEADYTGSTWYMGHTTLLKIAVYMVLIALFIFAGRMLRRTGTGDSVDAGGSRYGGGSVDTRNGSIPYFSGDSRVFRGLCVYPFHLEE